MEARGLMDSDLIEGATRSIMAELPEFPVKADNVLVFR